MPLEYRYPLGLGIVFDLDGVVVDSEPASLEACKRAYAEVGVELSEDDLHALMGRTDQAGVSLIWERHGYFMKAEEFEERHQRHYEQLAAERGIAPFPGAMELLDELDEDGVAYALATSGRPAKVRASLRAAGLAERFSMIVSGADVSLGKPDPEIFLLAAEAMALPAERCIVIEDSQAGVEAARRAGMACIAVTHSFPASVLSGAECVMNSLEEVNTGLLRKLSEAAVSRQRGF